MKTLKRIFLLKFAKPDQRQSLVIDSGFRCHLTSFTRATAAAPSAFVTRLRKFLRTRRVTAVSQVGELCSPSRFFLHFASQDPKIPRNYFMYKFDAQRNVLMLNHLGTDRIIEFQFSEGQCK